MQTPALLLALLVATAGAALADTQCPNTKEDAIAIPVGERTFYVWNDPCQPDCLFSVWISEESNGVPGYQHPEETCDCTGEYRPECDHDRIWL